jgi:hypothetical protein
MQCVYCTEKKPNSSFKKREHVIPQCFGKFAPDNLTLRGCVCDDCNQLLGNRLELFLGRDTFESIERLRHGMKPKEPLKDRRRVRSKVKAGAWKGVIVRDMYLAESGTIAIEKAVQAGFYHINRAEYHYFERANIPTREELVESGYNLKDAPIWLIAEAGPELDDLVSTLNERGIDTKLDSSMVKRHPPGEIVPVETEITLDRAIMRGFCKIAFNYLTFVAGAKFVLSSDFDEIRRFVLKDQGESLRFFAVNLPPILHDDQRLEKVGKKVTEGHLIIVDWRGSKVVSKISLFNTLTFGIFLCREFKGIWRPIKSGHHFDLETKQVTKLISVSKALLPGTRGRP